MSQFKPDSFLLNATLLGSEFTAPRTKTREVAMGVRSRGCMLRERRGEQGDQQREERASGEGQASGGVYQVGPEGCWENIETRSALMCLMC